MPQERSERGVQYDGPCPEKDTLRSLGWGLRLSVRVRKKGSVSFLAAFFPWLFHSTEFWSAIIGIVGAFIGAVIGGRIAGRYALRAQQQAAEDQRRRDLQADRRAVNGILRSIAAELQVLKRVNFQTIQNSLNEREARQKLNPQKLSPFAMVRSEQNYFVVFESNAAALGGINDEKLREDIIRVYGLAKGLVDLLNANSRNFEIWRSLQEGTHEKPLTASMLERLEIVIRNGLNDVQRELDELLKKIERYLDL
jgi:hypothetical protein